MDLADPTRFDHIDTKRYVTLFYSALAQAEQCGSYGCGSPTELIDLQPGDVVLDIGCGNGVDCLQAFQKIGRFGHVVGVDISEKMLWNAQRNLRIIRNLSFSLCRADVESIPLHDGSVDAVIANCVINLMPRKEKIFEEAYRILKPGHSFSLTDIVTQIEMPPNVSENLNLLTACLGGALRKDQLIGALNKAGFTSIQVRGEQKLILGKEDIRRLAGILGDNSKDLEQVTALSEAVSTVGIVACRSMD